MQRTFASPLSTHLTPAPGNFWRGFVLGCRNTLRPAPAGQLVQAGCGYAGGLGDLRTGIALAFPTTPTVALWPAGCCGRLLCQPARSAHICGAVASGVGGIDPVVLCGAAGGDPGRECGTTGSLCESTAALFLHIVDGS